MFFGEEAFVGLAFGEAEFAGGLLESGFAINALRGFDFRDALRQ